MRAVTAEALAAVTESHTGINLGIDDPTSRWCAAIAATHLLWRDGPLEDVHAGVGKPGGISDADMMRANVITTRHVAGALAGDGCDWRRLATELTDAGRPIGEVALSEFVGAVNVDGLRRHALAEARRLDALAGNDWSWLRTFLACSGSMREWFGVPWVARPRRGLRLRRDRPRQPAVPPLRGAGGHPRRTAAGARRAGHRTGDGPRAPIRRGARLVRR